MSAASATVAAAADKDPQPSTRRDHLLEIERRVQAKWAENKVHEIAPGSLPRDPQSKYLATFPYPYMNGALHLGHAFTLVKVDYQCNYQRLKGKNVLFPFGFHCTGMPIAACADKLRKELQMFGNPPVFPATDNVSEAEVIAAAAAEGDDLTEDKGAVDTNDADNVDGDDSKESASAATTSAPAAKKRTGKSKVAKKKSKQIRQWNILKEMNVPENELASFADPYHWLKYFPPLAINHLKSFGLAVDFRRSFITTSVNPYYDAFIRWQFNTLKKKNKLAFGARLSVFSPIDNQACADHDRAEGEGVGLTDYTLIKIELQQPYPPALQAIIQKHPHPHVYLPAATLRPETMYGQTNVFVLPEGEYGVFDISDDDVFICSVKSALNMSFQNIGRQRGKPEQIGTIRGEEIIGGKVKAPLCTYDHVYVLPLMSIKMDKGTGVVTSVPSDAPDDYAALTELKKKPAFREKFHLTDEMVLPFEVVPVIFTPGLGNQPAVDLCIEMKVISLKDRVKLDEIKDRTYKEGFAKGIMLVGDYKDVKVSEAKPKIKADLISRGQALAYSEPESRVISRSGNECVAALSDQWYLKYGETEWAAIVRRYIESSFETYNPLAKKDFLSTMDWLHEWGASRSYGLGTQLPWDKQYVIESLSDSTIYMAYYTIAHHLQGGVLDGSQVGPAKIQPDQLTDEVFDYIFCSKVQSAPPQTDILLATLNQLRDEFEYWYPMDLRVSGKDLIQNHLTFSLYNHSAIWDYDEKYWPQSFFTNGHVLIDTKKMSKSEGNFITLNDAISMFSADATRLVLADSGDSMEDANFETKAVNAAILKLTKEEAWFNKLPPNNELRSGPLNFLDRVFMMEMDECIRSADEGFGVLQYRTAVKAAFHDLLSVRDSYRLSVVGESPIKAETEKKEREQHGECIQRYLHVFTVLLSPICPHFAQHMWELTSLDKRTNTPFVCNAKWPDSGAANVILRRQIAYIRDTNLLLRRSYVEQLTKLQKTKSKGKPTPTPPTTDASAAAMDALTIFVVSAYPQWQQQTLGIVAKLYNSTSPPSVPERKDVIGALKTAFGGDKKAMENSTKFAQQCVEDLSTRGADALDTELPFNELALVNEQIALVTRNLLVDAENIRVELIDVNADVSSLPPAATKALPGKPSPYFYKRTN